MPTLKIMLVDDHPVVRAGLRAVLTEQGGLQVLAEAADGAAALAQLERLKTLGERVDVVLMDLQMDGMDGATATARIRAINGPPVLILTTYDSDADIRAALDAGAAGYLLKDAPLPDVLAAVEAAAAGAQVLSADIAARFTPDARANSTDLSPRELQLLQLLARGHSNKEIAADLFISQSTVKTHLIHIYNKLGVENRTAAIDRARSLRLIR
ncbi:response regulator transcription factor [Paeniglutamicibacter terrestris]|uniref:Response regulator transcription factor n=1 Tax=Paeniglutamicibacter terrestris TaxID=2723403 RepID=A0ABX1G3K0_9MICC|nr:response regulator transcription factor [Paeniglutamicibacter terrestris]ASN37682.1 DNA-binding response regulator [Arthrobacter sp. 7749]NKG20150.1 response regulator transcription factor [Paeniglutamicibacter terrestris]